MLQRISWVFPFPSSSLSKFDMLFVFYSMFCDFIVSKLYHRYSSCPAFSQLDRAGQRHPARWIQLLKKTENARWSKLPKNSRKTSESYETRENVFDKTYERLFFEKLSVSFRTIFGKFENQQKPSRKWFWTDSVKNTFSENCRQILSECSVHFRFFAI